MKLSEIKEILNHMSIEEKLSLIHICRQTNGSAGKNHSKEKDHNTKAVAGKLCRRGGMRDRTNGRFR